MHAGALNGAGFPQARVTEEAREPRLEGAGLGGPHVRLGASTRNEGGAGAMSGRAVRPDIRALALRFRV